MATPSPTPAPAPAPTPTPAAPPVDFLYMVPVGAVIPWYPPPNAYVENPEDPDGPKVLVYPPGFAPCDGNPITDKESPFAGGSTPNLINRYALGAGNQIACGAPGGSETFNTAGWNNPAFNTLSTAVGEQDNAYNDIIQNTQPTYETWRFVLTTDHLTWNDGNHHHLVPANSFWVPNPGYVALIMIIRIK